MVVTQKDLLMCYLRYSVKFDPLTNRRLLFANSLCNGSLGENVGNPSKYNAAFLRLKSVLITRQVPAFPVVVRYKEYRTKYHI